MIILVGYHIGIRQGGCNTVEFGKLVVGLVCKKKKKTFILLFLKQKT